MNPPLLKQVTKGLNAAAVSKPLYLANQQVKPDAAAVSKPLYLTQQPTKPDAAAVKQHLQKDRPEQLNQ